MADKLSMAQWQLNKENEKMFHKKIDKLQNDVDEILDLCSETSEDGEYQEMGEMILRAQEGELDEEGYKKLEQQLTEDKEAVRYYVDFQMLTVLLKEHFDKSWLRRVIDAVKEHIAAGV